VVPAAIKLNDHIRPNNYYFKKIKNILIQPFSTSPKKGPK